MRKKLYRLQAEHNHGRVIKTLRTA